MPSTKHTPMLIGVGAATRRAEDPRDALEPIALMREAVQRAGADAGDARWLSAVDDISAPQGLWAYSDPGRLVADAIGADKARTALAQIGVLQHTLISRAMRNIASGQSELALVIGGEAKYRSLRAAITGIDVADTPQTDVEPDQALKPERELVDPAEQACGLALAVHYYAIMENALRAAQGQSVSAHRDEIAEMWSAFGALAADNPDAWRQAPASPEAIREGSDKNAMMAFPYTKLHSTQWNVDQAAALLFCSARWARERGLEQSRAVWPLSATEANHMTSVSERAALHRCPGAAAAGQAALELAGIERADALDHIELYSCFPIAARMQARELGMDPAAPTKPLTVTGGMRFAGGPLNNYVLQATVSMAKRIRQRGGCGMVSGISGFMTKQGFGIWRDSPPEAGFRFADLSRQTANDTELRQVVVDAEGPARIAGYTVLHEKNMPVAAVAVCDLPDGRRTVARCEDAAVMARMLAEECTAMPVTLSGRHFRLSASASN